MAGDANLTEGELAKVDVGCFVQCSSPKRASKESSPSFLGVRTSRNPKKVLLLARGWPTQALGDHRLSMLRDKQDCCQGWGTVRTTDEGRDSTKLAQV